MAGSRRPFRTRRSCIQRVRRSTHQGAKLASSSSGDGSPEHPVKVLVVGLGSVRFWTAAGCGCDRCPHKSPPRPQPGCLYASSAPASRAHYPLDVMPRRPAADRLAHLPAALAGFVRARAAGSASAWCRFSYGNALAACAAASAPLAFAEQLYCAAWKDGLSRDAYICSTVVDLLAKHGRLGDALRAFEDGDRGSAVCWNTAISGAARNGEHALGVEMFRDMVRGSSCEPNSFTYCGALSACAAGAELGVGRAVHGMVLRRDPEYDVFVGTSIVNMYVKCGQMGAAMNEFWRMPIRNVVSWTTAIAGFVQEEDPVSAMLLLTEMLRSGVAINKYTATSILLACSQMSMIWEANQVHGMIMLFLWQVRSPPCTPDVMI